MGHGFTPMSANVRDLSDGHCSHFRIGGIAIELRGVPDAAPSLERFQVIPACNSDIDIQVQWTETILQGPGSLVFDSGAVWRLFDDDQGLRFDFSAPALGDRPYRRLRIDDKYCYATIELSGEYFGQGSPAPHPLEYPLDELLIMHRLTQERAIELHGSGIVRTNGEGNLFVGHSGAGKSTTTRLWTAREEVEVLSDDRIIVRPDEIRRDAGTEELKSPTCDGGADAVETLRLRDCSALRSDHSAQDDRVKSEGFAEATSVKSRGMRMYGTPWHGEAMFASPNSAPLQRIFVLEHGQGNVITRLTRSQAVGELFSRAFVPFHRHEYVESALSFLEQLADSVPCYRYSFEPDQRAVDKILHFHD